MVDILYNSFLLKAYDSSTKINLAGDTIKVSLHTSSYVPDRDTHDFFDDVTNEVTGTAYTAGGVALATKTWTQDNAGDKAVFDADDASWPASTISAIRRAVIRKDTGTASTSPVIGAYDFGADQATSGSEFRIIFPAAGILSLAQA